MNSYIDTATLGNRNLRVMSSSIKNLNGKNGAIISGWISDNAAIEITGTETEPSKFECCTSSLTERGAVSVHATTVRATFKLTSTQFFGKEKGANVSLTCPSASEISSNQHIGQECSPRSTHRATTPSVWKKRFQRGRLLTPVLSPSFFLPLLAAKKALFVSRTKNIQKDQILAGGVETRSCGWVAVSCLSLEKANGDRGRISSIVTSEGAHGAEDSAFSFSGALTIRREGNVKKDVKSLTASHFSLSDDYPVSV